MECKSAILYVHREPGETSAPSLLQNLLFCPAALWLVRSLTAAGVERFFAVCDADVTERAAACLPSDRCEVVSGDDPDLEAKLKAFAAGTAGKVLTFTQPLWLSFAGAALLTSGNPLPVVGKMTGAWRSDAAVVAEKGLSGLETGEPFAPPAGEDPLAIVLREPGDLETAQYLGRYDVVSWHSRRGVRFLDPHTAYIDPTVEIGKGTLVLPGTILKGNTVIGENCEIGPNSMIRDCVIGRDTTVNASQLKWGTSWR